MSAERSAERDSAGPSTSAAPLARDLFEYDSLFEHLVWRKHASQCIEAAEGCLGSLIDLAKPGTPVVFLAALLLTHACRRGFGDVSRGLELVRSPAECAQVSETVRI